MAAYVGDMTAVFANAAVQPDRDAPIVIVVNDSRSLYPEILTRAGLSLDDTNTRHGNRRTGRRAGEFFESILICRLGASASNYAGWRIVEPYVAVLRAKPSRQLRADPGSTKRASDDFWEMVSGAPDFGPRSLQASTVLAAPVAGRRASADVARIQAGSIH